MATITGSQRLLDLDGNNFTTSVTLGAGGTLLDSDGQAGNKGQILSSTGGATNWIDATSFTNNYVSGISFNTSNGILTLTRSGLGDLTVDLDGRYLTTAPNYFLNGITKSGNTLTFSVSGTTNQTFAFGSNAFNSTTIYAQPGIFSGGGTPTLASGVTALEVRNLIGAGTGSGTSNLVIGTTSTTAMAGDTTTITAAQATAIINNSKKVSDTGTPAVLSNGSSPSLNSGISALEMRNLIGAGTGSGTSNLVIGTTSTTAKAGNITTITSTQAGNITTNNSKVSDTGTPAVLSNGSTPSLNSGISAAEMRGLIGAGTGNGSSNLALGSTSTTAKRGDTTTISAAQASAITANSGKTSDTGVPAILSNGSLPSLNSGISAAEVRSLIGAGTSSSAGVTRVRGTSNRISVTSGTDPIVNAITGTVNSSSVNLATGAQIQTAINSAVTGVLKYKGIWDAAANSPTLQSAKGTPGEYYIVSKAGNTNLDGITDWAVGDWAVFSDQATDAWQKIDNTQVGNVTGSGSSGRVAFWNSASNLTSDSDITFNGSSLVVGGTVTAQTGNSVQWAEAYNNQITAFSDSGSSTITLTLTQEDGGTLTTSFSNPQGTTTPSNTQTFTNKSGNISQWNNNSGYITSASLPSVGNGQIDGRTSGNGLSGSMDATANQSGNTTFTVTSNAATTATASTIAYRDSSADLNVRLLRANYTNQSTISGAIAFRVNNSSDNYTRYCDNPSAIRAFIGAGTSSTTGTVRSIATSTGLSGGTITTTGTITNTDRGSQQSIFKNVSDGTTKITATSNNDTLNLIGCKGTTLKYDPESKSIQFCADQQSLSLSGTTLTLSDGGSVTLPTSTGPQGPKGDKGDTGSQGIQGIQGIQGETGDKGDKGNTGSTGSAGAKGDKGDTGSTGSQGPKGDTGDTGGKGDPGTAGAKGNTGNTGSQGPQGNPGVKGDTGAAGSNGSNGAKGDTGNTGSQGPKGDTGDTGAAGSNGSNGAKGDKGDPGTNGTNGAAGARGATGSTGSQGAKGDNGDQGEQGDRGPQGIQGIQGQTGATGAAGSDAEVSGYTGSVTVVINSKGATQTLEFKNGLLQSVK